MKFSKWMSSLLIAGSVLTLTGVASAHVTVSPTVSTPGAYEEYTFRVPVEKDINTTGLRIEFPTGEKLSMVKPVAGRDYSIENDANGLAKSITWKATAGGLKPHEFSEFSIIAVNPKDATSLTWKAYQMYADGSEVDWTGNPSAQTPAPVTKIVSSTGTGTQPSTNQVTTPTQAAPVTTPLEKSSNLPLILSAVAVLIAVVGLFRKKA